MILKIIIFFVCFAAIVVGGFIAWLLYTPWGARFAVREAARATLGSKKVSWDKLEGKLANGISVQNLEVRDLPRLPVNNFLRIQGMTIRLRSLSLNGVELMVEHGRFFPHGDDSIVFSVRVVSGSFVANAYTRHLNLADVRGILVEFFDVPPLKGTLNDIDLTARGSFARPQVQGTFTVERIEKESFVLTDSPVAVDLAFVRGQPWETHGRLTLQGGQLTAPNKVVVKLGESVLIFQGKLQQPQLNLKGSAFVSRTKINISVRGTIRDPELELNSDPPHTKDELLMMLGLRDIVLSADPTAQGFTVSKELSGRLDIGYGVRRQVNVAQPSTLKQTVDSEFRVSNKVTFGIQKELRARSSSTNAGVTSGNPADQSGQPDDRVYMQYKTRF
jgi:autotransporter translocation and assembly factor TamB